MASDRKLLQEVAKLRLDEAKLLMRERLFSGAYYVAGYAVECALKAKIATQFKANEIPDKSLVNNIYTHDLEALLRLSGLQVELETTRQNDPRLYNRWLIVKNWTEQARYTLWTEDKAGAMMDGR
jgi:hypothetical protein